MDSNNNRGMRDWLIFIRTAEVGSLGEAARQLDISTAGVSKAVSRFEHYLGTVLFTRTAYGMILTEAGQRVLTRARDIVASFHSLLEEIRNPDNEVKGTIRLTAPAIVCEFLANEWAMDYIEDHPNVKVSLDARERTDLNRDSPELDDLVLRSGRIESEDLVHRALSPLQLVLCASPRYLRQQPVISHPRDLHAHRLLRLHHHGLAGPLMLSRGEESYLLEDDVSGNGVSSNNLSGMMNLATKGHGISLATPRWLASGYVARGQLELILPEWKIPDLPVWLIWRQRRQQSRLFNDFRNYVEQRWNTLLPVDVPDRAGTIIPPGFVPDDVAEKQ